MRTRAQFADLFRLIRAAEHRDAPRASRFAQFSRRDDNLRDELASGRKDERERAVPSDGVFRARGAVGEGGEEVRDGLARARLCEREDVAAGEEDGRRARLHGGGTLEAHLAKRHEGGRVHAAELAEAIDGPRDGIRSDGRGWRGRGRGRGGVGETRDARVHRAEARGRVRVGEGGDLGRVAMEAALEGRVVDGGVVYRGEGLDGRAGAVVVDDRGRGIVGARARRASLARADEAHHRVELVRVESSPRGRATRAPGAGPQPRRRCPA